MSLLLILLLVQEDAKVTRGPYLQSVTPNSIVICWQTDREVDGIVEFGETEKLGRSTAGPAGGHHAVELRNLKPATAYHYSVGDRSGRFRTPPVGDGPVTFLLYGDTRSYPKTHAKVAALMARENADLVVNSGDLVANGRNAELWPAFFESAAPLLRSVPLYPALGNHDNDAPQYFDAFVLPGNERYYSFDYGSAHFIVLDSNGRRRKDEGQLKWLRNDLASTKKPFKFAVYHHPIASTSLSKSRVEDSEDLYALWGEIFEKGGLTAALQGHNHNYQRAEKNGVLYFTSGGGGAELYPVGEALKETKYQKSVHHYVRFRIEGKKATIEAIDLEGKTLDRHVVGR